MWTNGTTIRHNAILAQPAVTMLVGAAMKNVVAANQPVSHCYIDSIVSGECVTQRLVATRVAHHAMGGGMAHDGHLVSSGDSGCASCAAGGMTHSSVEGGEVIYDGPARNSAPSQMAPSKMAPTPAQPKSTTPPAASPMPEAGTTTRSTSPALRKRSSIQQASAKQVIRKR